MKFISTRLVFPHSRQKIRKKEKGENEMQPPTLGAQTLQLLFPSPLKNELIFFLCLETSQLRWKAENYWAISSHTFGCIQAPLTVLRTFLLHLFQVKQLKFYMCLITKESIIFLFLFNIDNLKNGRVMGNLMGSLVLFWLRLSHCMLT